MTIPIFLFYAFAALSILGALGMVLNTRNTVTSAMQRIEFATNFITDRTVIEIEKKMRRHFIQAIGGNRVPWNIGDLAFSPR